jgi:hypothetical protein
MKNLKNADSLVWIIIWIFILAIALLGIINVLWFSQNTLSIYKDSINKYIVESNVENITKKLSNDIIDNSNTFFLYKDTINKEFKYLTWSINEEYKYIDKLWNKVNPTQNIWKTYKVELTKKIDILKHVIYPPEIDNIVFQYDALNVDWSLNSTLSDWSSITTWKDVSWNWNDAKQTNSSEKPTLSLNAILNKPWVKFEWNQRLKIDDNEKINTNNDSLKWINWIIYNEKSLAIVLKTWYDITSDQVIYEQWWTRRWYSYMIHDWDLYAWIWNNNEWDNWHKYKSVNLWSVYPDTIYFIIIVQDSTHWEYLWWNASNNDFDDDNNTLKIYLNWELTNFTTHTDPQVEHPLDIWIWALTQWTVLPRSPYNSDWWDNKFHFEWFIWELIEWNHALTNNEVRWFQNYLKEKRYWATSNIKYHRIENSVKKVN